MQAPAHPTPTSVPSLSFLLFFHPSKYPSISFTNMYYVCTVYQPLMIRGGTRISSYPLGAYRQERENEIKQLITH